MTHINGAEIKMDGANPLYDRLVAAIQPTVNAFIIAELEAGTRADALMLALLDHDASTLANLIVQSTAPASYGPACRAIGVEFANRLAPFVKIVVDRMEQRQKLEGMQP